MKNIFVLLALPIALALSACTTKPARKSQIQTEFLIIAHRGASAYRPEHTLAAYELAIEMAADYIEMDLVITKDGVLIARHENELSLTTDVAKKFPKRKAKKNIDGRESIGWFSEDFTLQEIKTLRAKERLSTRDQSRNGQFEVPTFAEIVSLVQERSRQLNRVIGIYPEIKNPTYFASIGLPLEPALAKELQKAGWTKKEDPVFIQSFELAPLRKLKGLIDCRLIFLIGYDKAYPFDGVVANDPRTYGDFLKPEELRKLSELVDGIGPWKRLIVPEEKNGNLRPATTLVQDAHAAGLKVHPYTFRSDAEFLNKHYGQDPSREYQHFLDLGVDGVFTDNPDHASRAIRKTRDP